MPQYAIVFALVSSLLFAVPAAAQDAVATETTTPERPDLGGGRIVWGGQRHRVLHFTFDDGPRPDTTPALLDMLDQYGVHATFFVVARQLDPARRGSAERIEIVRDMIRRGHTVGLHSWDHPHLSTLTNEQIVSQIDRSEAVMTPILGGAPTLFRPPYGEHDPRIDRVLEERGYTEVLWNFTGEPVGGRTEDDVVAEFTSMMNLRESRSSEHGGVVILHDTRPHVVRAFPRIMEEIARRNCELYESGEELWTVSDDLSPFFETRHEGDAYDRRVARRDLPEDLVSTTQASRRAEAEASC
jgi:peptidoglycan/xylan/chitin deacetylase (PgdA/CDA1 family)